MLSITKEVIQQALPYVKGRVLDLGAGMAKYKLILSKKAQSYVACDVRKTEGIDVVSDVMNLVFPSESFDTVISTQVFEHVSNPFMAAREIKRVLKPGGHAIITAPFMVPFHPDPQDNFRFSKDGLKEVFELENFEVLESGIYGGFFMVMSEMIHFSWFDPYQSQSSKLMVLIEKIARFLDNIFSSKSIYANVFVVVRKR